MQQLEQWRGGHAVRTRHPGNLPKHGAAWAPVKRGLQLLFVLAQMLRERRHVAVFGLVDQVVGDAAEGVQGVRCPSLLLWKQTAGE